MRESIASHGAAKDVPMTHHRAKLTNDQVRQMRAKYLAYVIGYETLAAEFGCGISTARDICTYRTRRNVL